MPRDFRRMNEMKRRCIFAGSAKVGKPRLGSSKGNRDVQENMAVFTDASWSFISTVDTLVNVDRATSLDHESSRTLSVVFTASAVGGTWR